MTREPYHYNTELLGKIHHYTKSEINCFLKIAEIHCIIIEDTFSMTN